MCSVILCCACAYQGQCHVQSLILNHYQKKKKSAHYVEKHLDNRRHQRSCEVYGLGGTSIQSLKSVTWASIHP